jgi:hypothetical protein
LQQLWQQEYGASVDFAQLAQRTEFVLKNPFIKNIDDAYKAFIYRPKP